MPATRSTPKRIILGVVTVVVGLGFGAGVAACDSGSSSESNPTTPTTVRAGTTPTVPRTVAVRERLPDLFQEPPSQLEIQATGAGEQPGYVLGFRSAVRNVGAGPLIVRGTRPDTSTRQMTVDQRIVREGETQRLIPDVGRMEYVVSPTHRHWHYLQFDRYELRRPGASASSKAALVTDRKSGFCLGDRYRASRGVKRAAPQAVYTSSCGLDRPDRLVVHEGISVGYGDDYPAFLEGQNLPIDDVPDGRYVLVHRANGDGNLEESSYANNAASVLLELRRTSGTPRVRVLKICPQTDRCTLPTQSGDGQ